jgi:hypothetical protein
MIRQKMQFSWRSIRLLFPKSIASAIHRKASLGE